MAWKSSGSLEQAALRALKALGDDEALRTVCDFLVQRPQLADGVVRFAIPELTLAPSKALTDKRYVGTIESFDESSNIGVIECQELREAWECDVTIAGAQLGVFGVGDSVSFAAFMDEGYKPQAFDLVTPGPNAGGGSLRALPQPGLGAVPTEPVSGGLAPSAPPTVVEVPGVTDRRFSGIVLSGPGRMFGFIKCDELREFYTKDVWVHSDQLGWANVGDAVTFAVLINKDGHPQAKEVVLASEELPPASAQGQAEVPWEQAPGGTDQRFSGTVVSFNPTSGFGFIQCEELKAVYQKDVWVHSEQLKNFKVGQDVTFATTINKNGYPQARDLLSPSLSSAPPTTMEIPGVTDKRFTGTVVRFNAGQNFGFIACPELKDRYSKDIWVHGEQLGSFDVGASVSFGVLISKQGHPQAKELSTVPEPVAGSRPAPRPLIPAAQRRVVPAADMPIIGMKRMRFT